jgi:hypothetical protein
MRTTTALLGGLTAATIAVAGTTAPAQAAAPTTAPAKAAAPTTAPAQAAAPTSGPKHGWYKLKTALHTPTKSWNPTFRTGGQPILLVTVRCWSKDGTKIGATLQEDRGHGSWKTRSTVTKKNCNGRWYSMRITARRFWTYRITIKLSRKQPIEYVASSYR